MEIGMFGGAERSHQFAAPQRPREPAPHKTASMEERADWSERYVAWFISQTPEETLLPDDVSPSHRYEVELAYCKLDPQQYEQETSAELDAYDEPTVRTH